MGLLICQCKQRQKKESKTTAQAHARYIMNQGLDLENLPAIDEARLQDSEYVRKVALLTVKEVVAPRPVDLKGVPGASHFENQLIQLFIS